MKTANMKCSILILLTFLKFSDKFREVRTAQSIKIKLMQKPFKNEIGVLAKNLLESKLRKYYAAQI